MSDQTIDDVYTFLDLFWTESMPRNPCLAHGMYHGRYDTTSFDEAQENQRRYVMEELQIGPGSRVIDIGCGYGSMLEDVRDRGGSGMGITLSERQAVYCVGKGLNVERVNWKNLPQSWNGRFDCVIANGCLEHFVTPEEVAAGLQEPIYRSFFRRCAELLDPSSSNQRLFVSSIFQRRFFEPRAAFGDFRNRDEYMVFLLNKMYGDGWYPRGHEQITDCATGDFLPLRLEDGTRDYLQTYYHVQQKAYRTWSLRKVWKLVTHGLPWVFRDKQILYRAKYLYHGAWGWQFEGAGPPMGLISITFERRTAGPV